jgi:hypothetical protein
VRRYRLYRVTPLLWVYPDTMLEDRLPNPELHSRWKRCFDRLTELREFALSLSTQTSRTPAEIELLERLQSAIHEEGRLAAILLVAANLSDGIGEPAT